MRSYNTSLHYCLDYKQPNSNIYQVTLIVTGDVLPQFRADILEGTRSHFEDPVTKTRFSCITGMHPVFSSVNQLFMYLLECRTTSKHPVFSSANQLFMYLLECRTTSRHPVFSSVNQLFM